MPLYFVGLHSHDRVQRIWRTRRTRSCNARLSNTSVTLFVLWSRVDSTDLLGMMLSTKPYSSSFPENYHGSLDGSREAKPRSHRTATLHKTCLLLAPLLPVPIGGIAPEGSAASYSVSAYSSMQPHHSKGRCCPERRFSSQTLTSHKFLPA